MPMNGGDSLRAHLAARAARVRDLSPAMRVIGEEMVTRGHQAFRERQSQTGDEWAVLAASTMAARAAKLPGAKRRKKGHVTPAERARLKGLGLRGDLLPGTSLTKGAKAKRGQARRLAGLGVSTGVLNSMFPPLVDTGRLRQSQRYQLIGKTGLRWSVVGYGGYHIGGAPRANIPARNFAPIERVGASDKFTLNAPMRAYAVAVLRRYIGQGVAAP